MIRSIFTIASLASIAFSVDTSSCKTVTCGSTASDGEKCVAVSGSSVVASPCKSGSSCSNLDQFKDDSSWSDATCEKDSSSSDSMYCPNNGTLHTYMPCCSDKDCYSQNCNSDHCEAIAEGDTCSVDEDCDYMHFCPKSSYTCTKVSQMNETCEIDNQCLPGAGCNNKICTPYWSFDVGAQVSDPKYCKTFYTTSSGICDSVSVYVNGNKVDMPWNCTIGSTCVYKSDQTSSEVDSESCRCGGDGSSNGFCPKIYPNVQFDGVIFPKIQNSDSRCSGRNAHSADIGMLCFCHTITKEACDYYNAMNGQAESWSLHASGSIDSCSESLALYDASESLDSYSFAELLTVSAILYLTNL